jgi:hypothetical protein
VRLPGAAPPGGARRSRRCHGLLEARLGQDPRDQAPGKHEEQRDADLSAVPQPGNCCVSRDHEQDRDPAKPIESRYPTVVSRVLPRNPRVPHVAEGYCRAGLNGTTTLTPSDSGRIRDRWRRCANGAATDTPPGPRRGKAVTFLIATGGVLRWGTLPADENLVDPDRQMREPAQVGS